MPASFVQQIAAQNATTSASFPGAVTAGNLVVVSGSITAVSDNQGNTYHRAVTHANYVGVSIYYAYNVVGGPLTLTVTLTGFNRWVAEEWSGLGATDTLAGVGVTHGPNVSPVTASPSMPNTDGMAVVAVASNDFGWPESASGGVVSAWSYRMNTGGAFAVLVASGPITSTGTVTAVIGYHGVSNDDLVIAYFDPALAAPTHTSRLIDGGVINGPLVGGGLAR